MPRPRRGLASLSMLAVAGRQGAFMARTLAAVRRIDLSWVRLEIALLVAALIMGA